MLGQGTRSERLPHIGTARSRRHLPCPNFFGGVWYLTRCCRHCCSPSPKKALHLLSHHKPELSYQLPFFGVILDCDIDCDLGHRGFWPTSQQQAPIRFPNQPETTCTRLQAVFGLWRASPPPAEFRRTNSNAYLQSPSPTAKRPHHRPTAFISTAGCCRFRYTTL